MFGKFYNVPLMSDRKPMLVLLLVTSLEGALLPASLRARTRPAARVPNSPKLQLQRGRYAIDPIEVQIVQRRFESVRELPRVQDSLKNVTGDVLDVDDYAEPT